MVGVMITVVLMFFVVKDVIIPDIASMTVG